MSSEIVLVTGVSRGIGFEVVRQLAKRGMTMILTARDSEKGEAATKQLAEEGLNVIFKQLDASNDECVRRLAADLEQDFGKLDILINNAAVYTSWSETPSTANFKEVHDVLETTLFDAWRMIQVDQPRVPAVTLCNARSGRQSDCALHTPPCSPVAVAEPGLQTSLGNQTRQLQDQAAHEDPIT